MSETEPEVAFDVALSPLERIARELGLLRDRLDEPLRVLSRRLKLTDANNPIDIVVDDGYPFYSVLVENPSSAAGAIVEVGFAAGAGRVGGSARRVPRQTGVMIVRKFTVCSIGMATAGIAAAGGSAEVFVSLYDRPQPPHAYSFTP